jgi:hypothetical protein
MPDAAIDTQQGPDTTASVQPEQTSDMPVGSQLQEPQQPSAIQGSINAGQTTGPVSGQSAPPDQALVSHVSKLAQLGHVASRLLGEQQYQYQVDPKTGKTVAIPVKQKPGEVFRHIVAGAILGGMSSAGEKHIGPGIVKGTEVVTARNDQQAAIARQQTQQQYQNQLAAQKEQREQSAFKTEEDLKRIEMAHYNATIAETATRIQGQSAELHQKLADSGKVELQSWLDSGVKPPHSNVSESEMTQFLKDHPGASSNVQWFPSGMRYGLDKNGNPTYENSFTAIDSNAKVKVTQAQIDQWKKVGVDKHSDSLFDPQFIKAGREIDASTMRALQRQYQVLYNRDLKEQTDKSDIAEKNAKTSQYLAAAARDRAETTKLGKESKQAEVFSDALKELSSEKVNGNWDALSPGSKLVLGESANKMMADDISGYKAALAQPGHDEEAQKFLADYQFWQTLAQKSVVQKPPPPPPGETPVDTSTPEGKAIANFRESEKSDVAAKQKAEADKVQARLERPAEKPVLPVLGPRAFPLPNPAYDATEAYLAKHPELSPAQRAAVRKNATAVVKVQIPGQPAGQIPRNQLEAFKKANPKAVIIE